MLFYLREQAEIIQSGYLQRLKAAPGRSSVAELNRNPAQLCLESRDYFKMLHGFESVFGARSLALRCYQPASWQDGSIIWDLLDFLGCRPSEGFSVSRHKQNTSLDLESAQLLNVFDSYTVDSAGRKALVEDLLWLAERYPGGEKCFLGEAAVRHIRAYYHDSNVALARRYGIEFDYAPCWIKGSRDGGGTQAAPAFVDELARFSAYPLWHGEELSGPQLESLLGRSSGWSRFENWGVWSVGEESRIEFRLPRSRFSGLEEDFVVEFRGRYFSTVESTQVWLADELLREVDLRHASIRIPLAAVDEDRVARLTLRHLAPVSPADLGTGDDVRALSFGLHSLSYSLAFR
jgi:hypothetical protein